MRSHEIDYAIHGDDLQYVEIELDPGEVVVAEAGAMMYMEDGISFEARMGDGSEPQQSGWNKFKSAAKRVMAQESLFMTHFTNASSSGKRRVALGAPYPGRIIPIDLSQISGGLTAQKDAFLCAASGTKLDVVFTQKLGTGFFGGEGFILQSITGDGLAFLHAGGTIAHRQLAGETLRVDTGCIVAFEPHIQYSIERAGNLKSMAFGGEGMFLATLSGHGHVWLQSLPFNRLADRVLANSSPGGSQGEGSVIGGLSNIFER